MVNCLSEEVMKKLPGKWLIACSGGADSMALLSMCYKSKMDIIAITINYHVRFDSFKDVEVVSRFCKEHHIQHIVVDSILLSSNFQQAAREFRYKVFASYIKYYKADGLCTAHHQDDLIETYLWQKQRKHMVESWGITEQTTLFNIKVIRPLLSFSKADLITYNQINKIEYVEDSSNLQAKYTRNKIRMQCQKLTQQQKQEIIKQINQDNENIKELSSLSNQLIVNNHLDLDRFKAATMDQKRFILYRFLSQPSLMQPVSLKQLDQLIAQLLKKNIKEIWLSEITLIMIDNNQAIKLIDIPYDYQVYLDQLSLLTTPWFSLTKHNHSGFRLDIKPNDFPITIRNAKASDRLKTKLGTKKVFDWFTDQKIHRYKRNHWPVIVNHSNKVIGVFKWVIDPNHSTNNPSGFVIK